MLFHLGALWRLNELGQLPKLDRISSVSGGSITAATLGLAWNHLDFDAAGVARNLQPLVVDPVRRMAGHTVDVLSILSGLLTPDSIPDMLAAAFRARLFGSSTLQDLPDEPRFILNATNIQSKALWRFSRRYMGDYRVGRIENPHVELAVAVAASSAFPPYLSPVQIPVKPSSFTSGSGLDLQRLPYTRRVLLTDGGVYDNLGLETAWKRCRTILVSDGGGAVPDEPSPDRDWARHTYRVLTLIDNQVRSLRKRQLIDSLRTGDRAGAYWGIRSDLDAYGATDALRFAPAESRRLGCIPTRLKSLPAATQRGLINWGYALCDAALRTHVNPEFPRPAGLPYD